MLMTMVYHSSEGEAREELEQFLEIKGSEEEVYEERSVIRRQLQKERKGIRLMCAESFWIERPEDRDLGDLTEKLKEYYGCEVYPVKKFDEEIRQQINHWASELPYGKEGEILFAGIVNQLGE